MTRILVIDGHPDADRKHFIHAAADAYAAGAKAAGHEVRTIRIAELDFPLVRSFHQWNDDPPPAAIVDAQESLGWRSTSSSSTRCGLAMFRHS